mgnify:CR=1 FL=1
MQSEVEVDTCVNTKLPLFLVLIDHVVKAEAPLLFVGMGRITEAIPARTSETVVLTALRFNLTSAVQFSFPCMARLRVSLNRLASSLSSWMSGTT